MTNTDLVTQLQDQLSVLCSLFFNFTGALQRDAPPVSVRGEPVDPIANAQDTPAQVGAMAEQIVSASKVLDDLIAHLPDISATEEDQLEAIVNLQLENDKVGDELRDMQKVAEFELQKVQAVFGILADDALQRRSQLR
ncbi:probable mediator of RNA polymerase II transcription subunit 21 [Coccomyxa sp. Obi]|nr:probable mediator of RNA polymerase II transcription subunit 21 [Coccomyxa sp. Obi]